MSTPTPQPPKIIAIAGFTGKLSRLITTYLLQHHPTIKIHGIYRTPSKLDPTMTSHPNITLFQVTPTDPTSLRAALKNASVCICCYLDLFSPSAMFSAQKTLIDACISEHVPRYIASDWCMDFRGLPLGSEGHPGKEPMKIVAAYLAERERDGAIQGVHILTGGFMEFFFAQFLGYVDVQGDVVTWYGEGEEKLDMISIRDAAAYTAEVAVDGDAVGFLNFLGDRKSIKEVATLYEKVYGVTPQLRKLGSQQDLGQKMRGAFESAPGNPFAWLALFYQYFQQEPATLLGELDNERYPGVKALGLEEFMGLHGKEDIASSFDF